MAPPQCILEINTRVWLHRFVPDTQAQLNDVPQQVIDDWAGRGFDAVWLMGVWLPSPASQYIAREHEGLRKSYTAVFPEWTAHDVVGSPYAVCGYEVNPAIGDESQLADFRERLHSKGLRLILDFIPNHTARDHPWVTGHPEYYVNGTAAEIAHEPGNWFRCATADGERIIAHGRDPYFPGWTDTAQLDYSNPALQAAMRDILRRLGRICDGVRCDVAMLILSSVFAKTWNRQAEEFWPRAIDEVKRSNPDFSFIAEVYWGLEGELQQKGFDLTYDKPLLDDLAEGKPLLRERFDTPEFQQRSRLRFLENHDEPRIASRLDFDRHQAAAVWVFCLPSSRLFYDGQLDGQTVRPPVQLARVPDHPPDPQVQEFYRKLLPILKRDVIRKGEWSLLAPGAAWVGNETYHSILGQSYVWGYEHLRIFVNWSNHRAQCWVPLGINSLAGKELLLRDLLSSKQYIRDGLEIGVRGLYLDLEPWESQIFECTVQPLAEDKA